MTTVINSDSLSKAAVAAAQVDVEIPDITQVFEDDENDNLSPASSTQGSLRRSFKFDDISIEPLEQRKLGLIGKVVRWLRGFAECGSLTKVAMFTLVFFACAGLLLSLVGTPLLLLGFEEFVVQREEAKYAQIIKRLSEDLASTEKERSQLFSDLSAFYNKDCKESDAQLAIKKLQDRNRELRSQLKFLREHYGDHENRFQTVRFRAAPVRTPE